MWSLKVCTLQENEGAVNCGLSAIIEIPRVLSDKALSIVIDLGH